MSALNGGRVVIVGGGVIGLSIAFQLGRRGYGDVVVIERGRLGEGATAYATGGIRRQFTSRVNVELVQRSVEFWADFADRTGAPLEFRRHGYLFLLSDSRSVASFDAAVRMQRELGVDSQWLDSAQAARVFPGIHTEDLLAAVYTPTDGSATPADAVAGLATAARAYGVRIRRHTSFVGLTRDDEGHVTGARTSVGTFDAEAVVLAPGPWARAAGLLCGVDLPVQPHPRQAFATAPLATLNGSLPLAVDLASGAYLHPQVTGGAVIGGNDRDTPSTYRAVVDWSRVESLAAGLTHRMPFLRDLRVVKGWSGLREMTPDDLAIVGPVEQVPGVWVAVGFSGHGFMQSPAVGSALAAWLTTGAPDLDLTPLALNRFRPDMVAHPRETAVF